MKYDVSQDPEYLDIAAEIIGVAPFNPELTYTIAVFDDDCEFQGVVLFNNWEQKNVSMHCASVTPKWLTREVMKVVFTYAFLELKVQHVEAATREGNKKARSLARRLGFVKEGELRQYYESGESEIVYGMIKEECRWI